MALTWFNGAPCMIAMFKILYQIARIWLAAEKMSRAPIGRQVPCTVWILEGNAISAGLDSCWPASESKKNINKNVNKYSKRIFTYEGAGHWLHDLRGQWLYHLQPECFERQHGMETLAQLQSKHWIQRWFSALFHWLFQQTECHCRIHPQIWPLHQPLWRSIARPSWNVNKTM